MSKLVSVRALKSFTYQSATIEPGAWVSMEPIEASIHARHGHVSLAREYPTRQLVTASASAEPELTDPPRRRRGRPRKGEYHRSDLKAEP